MHKELLGERKSRKISQKKIAMAIGMHPESYGRKERGERPFELEEAIKVSVYLGVPLNRLFPDLFSINSDKNAQ